MSEIEESAGIMNQLDAATRRVVGKAVPLRLQAITDNHLMKLLALVETMRAAGVNEDLVRRSIRALIESYETELVAVMTSLAREEQE